MVSNGTLCLIRCMFACVTVAVLISSVTTLDPVTITLARLPGSLIRGPASATISGVNRLSTFTVQCWTLLSLYFIASALCSVALVSGAEDWVPRVARVAVWFAFEVSFSCALLVSLVTSYVLIPSAAARGNRHDVDVLFKWRPQMMHNANVFMLAVELLLNGMRLEKSHFPLAVLWGLNYVAFSWWWMRRTRGVVYYPFLDSTLPVRKSIPLHLILCLVLAFFFLVGCALGGSDRSLASRVATIGLMLVLVTKTPLHGKPTVATVQAAAATHKAAH